MQKRYQHGRPSCKDDLSLFNSAHTYNIPENPAKFSFSFHSKADPAFRQCKAGDKQNLRGLASEIPVQGIGNSISSSLTSKSSVSFFASHSSSELLIHSYH